MRVTKAYVASAGTAVVMLGASVCVFALVSAFVAFGSWPGTTSHTRVDQLVLRAVERPQAAKVAVNRNAVAIARRAAQRAAARTLASLTPSGAAAPVAVLPGPSQPSSSGHASPATTAPSGGGSGGSPPQKQVSDVTKTVDQTKQQVSSGVQNVQQQVDSVVNQVAGAPPPPPITPSTPITLPGH